MEIQPGEGSTVTVNDPSGKDVALGIRRECPSSVSPPVTPAPVIPAPPPAPAPIHEPAPAPIQAPPRATSYMRHGFGIVIVGIVISLIVWAARGEEVFDGNGFGAHDAERPLTLPSWFVRQHGDKMRLSVVLQDEATTEKWTVQIVVRHPQKNPQRIAEVSPLKSGHGEDICTEPGLMKVYELELVMSSNRSSNHAREYRNDVPGNMLQTSLPSSVKQLSVKHIQRMIPRDFLGPTATDFTLMSSFRGYMTVRAVACSLRRDGKHFRLDLTDGRNLNLKILLKQGKRLVSLSLPPRPLRLGEFTDRDGQFAETEFLPVTEIELLA